VLDLIRQYRLLLLATGGSSELAIEVSAIRSIAVELDTGPANLASLLGTRVRPKAPLLLPGEVNIAEQIGEPEPFRLPSIEDRLDDVRRQACEQQQPANISVRDILLGSEVGDRPGLPTLDPPPGAVYLDDTA
jgi:hypothetical protein